jgi:hypothetical protein
MVRGLRVSRKKKQIPRYPRNDNSLLYGLSESLGEEGLGVEVLLFEVGVEDHG